MKKLVLLVVFFLVSCAPLENYPQDKQVGNMPANTYVITTIEGMPCLILSNGGFTKGVTCDWSKWEGNGGG